MASISVTHLGSFEPPPAWTVELHPDYVAVRPPQHDAELRLTRYEPAATQPSVERWLEVCAHFTALKGRPVLPVRCGDFEGHATYFAGDETWVRGWVLRAGDLGLNATYRCALPLAGRDDALVDAALGTLRARQVAI